jgi:hypothetical protein
MVGQIATVIYFVILLFIFPIAIKLENSIFDDSLVFPYNLEFNKFRDIQKFLHPRILDPKLNPLLTIIVLTNLSIKSNIIRNILYISVTKRDYYELFKKNIHKLYLLGKKVLTFIGLRIFKKK